MDVIIRVFSKHVNYLCYNSRGATAIEYALIAGSIAIVIVGGLTLVGSDLSNVFGSVGTGFD